MVRRMIWKVSFVKKIRLNQRLLILELIAAIYTEELRLLRRASIHAESAILVPFIRAIEEDRNWMVAMFDAHQYRSEAARADTLADSLVG